MTYQLLISRTAKQKLQRLAKPDRVRARVLVHEEMCINEFTSYQVNKRQR